MLNVSSKYFREKSEEVNLSNFLTLLFLSWNSNTETVYLDQWFSTCESRTLQGLYIGYLHCNS